MSRRAPNKSDVEQQAQRAGGLGAQQAAYEALNEAQLETVGAKRRDLIGEATEQCGLGSVPPERSAAPADAAAFTQAAQRNDLLRQQEITIPWDHVAEWDVTGFWINERGLDSDSETFKQLKNFAASKTRGGCTRLHSSCRCPPPPN